jgi:hypothetical protein
MDAFGWSVAVHGDWALVGAPLTDVGASDDQGAAYVFHRAGTVWTFDQELKGSGTGERNGFAVALEDGVALVGAPLAMAHTNPAQGRVNPYTYNGTNWVAEPPLTPAGGIPGEHFGSSVDIDGATLVAGSPTRRVSGRTNPPRTCSCSARAAGPNNTP